MAKKRVYEIAKENNLTSKEVIWGLNKIDVEAKSHMSVIEDKDVEKVLEYFQKIRTEKNETVEQDKKSLPKEKAKKVKQEKPVLKKEQAKEKPKSKTEEKLTKQEKPETKKKEEEIKPLKPIEINEKIIVADLAELLSVKSNEVIKKLMELGIMATVNQEVDFDTASLLAEEYGFEASLVPKKDEIYFFEEKDDEAMLIERPPVVTVMGHVDHGKTSLLDAIRNENVVASEVGGITQHMGAYQVNCGNKKITFLDTPGHEAFTAMRARGAQATDIAILVVAADDGIMPQTVEAINHAKAAKVPIIVAINKIDKPSANPEKVKQELTDHGLVAEEWGGDTIMVHVSALKAEGIDNLLEMILLVAEMEDLKANPNRNAVGVVIEAELDKGKGPVATILIQKGTLKIGDSIVAGSAFGKVRAMFDDKGQRVKKTSPSTPVLVLGLCDVPAAGEIARVLDDKAVKQFVGRAKNQKREDELRRSSAGCLDDIFKGIEDQEVKELNVIVKADVQGSVEAVKQALEKLETENIKTSIIHGGVGSVTETDVMLASASGAIIIGFNVRPEINARKAAEIKKVDIRLYRVIYDALDDIKKAMSGLLDPEIKEVVLGRAEVRAVFKVPRAGVIAGSYVIDGKITNASKLRIIRNGAIVHDGQIDSLKRFKDDVKEVAQGYECGIGVQNFNDIKEQDIIEAYIFEEIKREL